MKKTILGIFILGMAGISISTFARKMSTGAPASSTGAPGETHCSTSGCHDDFPANTGTAISKLDIKEAEEDKYIPGKTYNVKVSVKDDGVQRFGFQLLTIKNSDLKNAGEFEITDEARTQIVNNFITLEDRRYMTYTYNGTAALKTGETDWTFNWKAPDENVGPITFYLATVSANNDNTDKGDHTFHQSLTLNPSTSTSAKVSKKAAGEIKAYYNSANNEVRVTLNPKDLDQKKIQIIDLGGKTIVEKVFEIQNRGSQDLAVEIPKDLTPGIYLVNLVSNRSSLGIQKIMLGN